MSFHILRKKHKHKTDKGKGLQRKTLKKIVPSLLQSFRIWTDYSLQLWHKRVLKHFWTGAFTENPWQDIWEYSQSLLQPTKPLRVETPYTHTHTHTIMFCWYKEAFRFTTVTCMSTINFESLILSQFKYNSHHQQRVIKRQKTTLSSAFVCIYSSTHPESPREALINRPVAEKQQQQQPPQSSHHPWEAWKQCGDSTVPAIPLVWKCLIKGISGREAGKWWHIWPVSFANSEAFLSHLLWVITAILIFLPRQMSAWINCWIPTKSILIKFPCWGAATAKTDVGGKTPAWDLMAHSFTDATTSGEGSLASRYINFPSQPCAVYDHHHNLSIKKLNHSRGPTGQKLLLMLTTHIFRSRPLANSMWLLCQIQG